MTDNDRYLFDLQGYLTIPNALDADQIGAMNAILDKHIAAEMAPDNSTHRFGGMLRWGQPFLDIIDNPRVEPCLREVLGEGFRLDHIYLDVIRSGLSPIGAGLHGGGTPYNPIQSYDFRNGHMYSGLFVAAYNLTDVGAKDGGFGCVPGSHKSNYPLPSEWKNLARQPPFVQAVTGPAGTAVLFTEALTHGALPWSGSGERRTLFYKYHHHGASWASNYPVAEDLSVNERQRRILEPPHAPGLGQPVAHTQ